MFPRKKKERCPHLIAIAPAEQLRAIAPNEAAILKVGPTLPNETIAGPLIEGDGEPRDDTPGGATAPKEATVIGVGPAMPDGVVARAAALRADRQPSADRSQFRAPKEATVIGVGPANPDVMVVAAAERL